MGRAAVAFAMEVEGPDSTVKQEGIDELDLALAEVKAAGNLEGFVDVTRAKTWLREQGLRGSKLASKLGGLSSRRNRQAHPVLRQMVVEIRELGGEKSVDLPDRELGADKPLESCEPEQENDLGCPGPVRKNEKGNEVDTTRTDGGSEMQSVSESDHQGAKATAGTVGTKAGEVEQEQAVLEKGEEYTTTVVSGDQGQADPPADKDPSKDEGEEMDKGDETELEEEQVPSLHDTLGELLGEEVLGNDAAAGSEEFGKSTSEDQNTIEDGIGRRHHRCQGCHRRLNGEPIKVYKEQGTVRFFTCQPCWKRGK